MKDIFNEMITSAGLAQYFQEVRDRLSGRLRDAKPQVDAILKGRGIRTVDIRYDGCGDSGQIDELDFLDEHSQAVEVPEEEAEVIRQFFYDILEHKYPGWEIDDGSCGEFRWLAETNDMSLEHTIRLTETETTETDELKSLWE